MTVRICQTVETQRMFFSLPWWIYGSAPDDSLDEEDFDVERSFELQDDDDEVVSPVLGAENGDEPYFEPRTSDADSSDSSSVESALDVSSFVSGIRRRPSDVSEEGLLRLSTLFEDAQDDEAVISSGGIDEVVEDVNNNQLIPDVDDKDKNENRDKDTTCDKSDDGSMEDLLNSVVDEVEEHEEHEVREVPVEPTRKDYPMMFTSFDDTTAIFNTTISGDVEMEDAIEDEPVFKFLKKETESVPSKSPPMEDHEVFKSPALFLSPRKSISESNSGNQDEDPEKKPRLSGKRGIAKVSKSSGDVVKKRIKSERSSTPIRFKTPTRPKTVTTPAVPQLARRETPSRRAKEIAIHYMACGDIK